MTARQARAWRRLAAALEARRDNLRRMHPECLERDDALRMHRALADACEMHAATIRQLLQQAGLPDEEPGR